MMRRAPSLGTLFTLAFAAGGLRASLAPLSDNSFLWHLRTGHLIIDSGIPRHDPYSFTVPGAPWVAQSWLAEVVYAGLDRAFGPFAVRLLMGATGIALAVVAFRLALRLAGSRVPAVLVTAAALWASATMWAPRPLMLGALALSALVWAVEVPASRLGRRQLVAVPVIMWVWVNVHGTYILGFAYLALHLLGRWLDGAAPWKGRERTLLLAGSVAGGVCLVNPYGPALVLFPFDLVGRDVLRDVVEWRSPDLDTVRGVAYACWTSVLLACLALGRNRPSRRDVVVAIPFVFLGWWALRNVTIAPLVTLPIAAKALARGAAEAPALPVESARRAVHWALCGSIVLLAGAWTVQAAGQADFDTTGYPVRAMRFLEREGLLGKRMLTEDWSAGYVILRWWPRQRVFVDDRYDMYPKSVVRDYVTMARGDEGWARVLGSRDVEVVVWSRGAVLDQLLAESRAWARRYRDGQTVVYERRR